jgi:hypothetical protein
MPDRRGNLIEWCRKCLPHVGEIQVADVPGRKEPGTGEINYPGVAKALKAMGYRGPVCMEAFASGAAEDAQAAFRNAFTVGKRATMVLKSSRPTVADLRAMKARGQKISMLYVTTLEEAAAADAAGIHMLSIEGRFFSPEMREAAGRCFVQVGLCGPFGDLVTAGHRGCVPLRTHQRRRFLAPRRRYRRRCATTPCQWWPVG